MAYNWTQLQLDYKSHGSPEHKGRHTNSHHEIVFQTDHSTEHRQNYDEDNDYFEDGESGMKTQEDEALFWAQAVEGKELCSICWSQD